MSVTTELGITKLEESQSGKEVTINEAIDKIDAAFGAGWSGSISYAKPGSGSGTITVVKGKITNAT
jgi:hypothetical protein